MKKTLMALVLGIGLTTSSHATPLYKITDLGFMPPGPEEAYARSINESGQIAGHNAFRSFLWEDGLFTDLDVLPGAGGNTFASAINNNAQIVGTAGSSPNSKAFIWQNGVMTDLGRLPGIFGNTEANGINNVGQVVGYSGGYAFIWQDGEMRFLRKSSDLAGPGILGNALDINDLGQVVGNYDIPNISATHAFIFHDGALTDLGILGHRGGYQDYSAASAINNMGQVAGVSISATGDRAFLWQNGIMIDLGDLPGGNDSSIAFDINNHGQVVGTSDRAFLWDNGVLMDLNDLIDPISGWMLSTAYSINDGGQIVGTGIYEGKVHAFLASPITPAVPEPNTISLMVVAALGLIAAKRRT